MSRLGKVISAFLIIFVVGVISAEALGLSFTLSQAQEQAIAADVDAIFAQRDIDNLVDTKEDVIETADDTNVLAGTAQTQLNSKVKKYIEPLRADMNISIALRNEQQRLEQRKADITNAYWQVYLAQLAIEKAEVDLEIAKNKYDAAKIKLSSGSISGSAVSLEKHSYESKQLSVIEANHKHKKAEFSLNELLGNELTTSVITKDKLELLMPTDWKYDIDSIYSTALIASENIYKLNKEAEYATMKLQYAGEEFQNTKDEYLDVVAEKEKAEYNFEDAKTNLYMSITTDGNNLLTSVENYKLLKLKLESEISNLKAMEIKFSNGQVSKNDYLQSKLSMLNYDYQLKSTIANINYSYQCFNIKYIFEAK